ncbi:MAG: helix-hairpin-helix domain-containing protein [Bacteroidales bacterium]|jgi:DNA uptake protein ComE-like DNA-binding protein|nr:helix-hairpin-helix domain-containing protein [Bacteroidales bacterium]
MKNFFNLSRREIVAAAILLAIIVILFLSSRLYHQQSTGEWNAHDFREKVRLLDEKQQAGNDLIETELQNSKTQRRIRYDFRDYKFGNSDYRFYKQQHGWDSAARRPFDSALFRARTAKQQYTIIQLNLNRCDTGDITAIPQFGAKRAQKLVEYRQKLGGFHSFEQVAEAYILQNIKPEHLAKYFFIDTIDIKKLEINNATYKELIAHPYFDAYLTKSILNYRNKNGKISSIAQLKEITKAYPELLEKIEPYLSFE